MRLLICIFVTAVGCSKDPGAAPRPDTTGGAGGACVTNDDCPPAQWCLHQRCSDRADPPDPTTTGNPHLIATPATLNFGSVAVGSSRTLALVVENDGDTVVTLREVGIAGPEAPFAVESMGYGPFWIRPTRVRKIFVTYRPVVAGGHVGTLTLHSAAPAVTVNLIGN